MAVNTDFKLIKEKALDEECTLKITKNIMSGRIFVEFAGINPKLTLQKNFQDTYEGKKESEEFSKSIKNSNQLRAYFKIPEKK